MTNIGIPKWMKLGLEICKECKIKVMNKEFLNLIWLGIFLEYVCVLY